jgi:hypothetical protein
VRPPPTPDRGPAQRRPLAGVGGFRFVADPQLTADQTAVFWCPEALPTVVPLAATHVAAAHPLDVRALGDVSAERVGADGRHVIVRTTDGDLRLWLADPADRPLAVVLPLDDDLPTRAAAALRLWAHKMGQGVGAESESRPLTRQRQGRLMLTVRALDGHLDRASYREIAQALFGSDRVEREAWKTSSLRDRTIRLVRNGVALMRSGYRKLLRGR